MRSILRIGTVSSIASLSVLTLSSPAQAVDQICPPVDVVFAMDTSTSLDDEAAALCSEMAAIQAELATEGITANVALWGITGHPGGAWSCLTSDVRAELGNQVPGDGGACGDRLDDIESWGPATAVVAERYPWTADGVRLIIPISDEGPCRGNSCQDSGSDRDSVVNAISIANQHGAFVSPIVGHDSDSCTVGLAQELADGTNGLYQITSDPEADLAEAVRSVIVDACHQAATCVLRPGTAFDPGQNDHTVTATIQENGSPIEAATIEVNVIAGPNQGVNTSGPSDANGELDLDYATGGARGVDELQATCTDAGGETSQSNTVLKFWDTDCNANDVPDTCDLDCGGFDGKCNNFELCGGGLNDQCNAPPVAVCADIEVSADSESCLGCGSVDAGSFDPDGDSVTITESPSCDFELGETSVTLTITDDSGASDSCTAQVRVVDDVSPVVDGNIEGDFDICTVEGGEVELTPPTTSDACSSEPTLVGKITGRNQVALDPPLEVPASGRLTLAPGEYVVQWEAADYSGNTTTITESFRVRVRNNLATCCDEQGRNTIIGGNQQDGIYHMTSHADFNVDGRRGGDHIVLGHGNDCVVGGRGGDNISSVSGHDRVYGGRADDAITGCLWNLGGSLLSYGGRGQDNISAQWCASSEIYGGPGSDNIAGSQYGSDRVVPGSGADRVSTFGGDDVIVIRHECEAEEGSIIDGGPGYDIVYSPLTADELEAAGVTLIGIESVEYADDSRHLADCE